MRTSLVGVVLSDTARARFINWRAGASQPSRLVVYTTGKISILYTVLLTKRVESSLFHILWIF